MTNLSAFQACFADFKLVKGRKVAQIVLEVAIEGADAALNALGGVPRSDREVWVGVARLNAEKASSEPPKPANEPKERRKLENLSLVNQAGIICKEEPFWQFLTEETNAPCVDERDAVNAVHALCGVASRSDLRDGNASGRRWCDLRDQYQAWWRLRKLAAEHVG